LGITLEAIHHPPPALYSVDDLNESISAHDSLPTVTPHGQPSAFLPTVHSPHELAPVRLAGVLFERHLGEPALPLFSGI